MIRVENVSKVYQGGDSRVAALIEIHIAVERGEFVAIVGPSGSGKSTLLNLLSLIDQPTDGHIAINGVPTRNLRNDALADFRRQNIGLVFQMFNLVPILSAVENVTLPLVPYPPKTFKLRKRAEELLAQMGLAERFGHLPSQLSGGEQQRVAVARALINQPPLLLADEPTGNLDSHAAHELIDLFSTLHKEQGVTIVMVTHDPLIAAQAQRIIELRDGRVVSEKVSERV